MSLKKEIQDYLVEHQDLAYRDFIIKLNPSIDSRAVIGVRMPILRQYVNRLELDAVLQSDWFGVLPYQYYEEYLIHALIINRWQDENTLIEQLNLFLPHLNSWSLIDVLNPQLFKKDFPSLLATIDQWLASSEPYTIRFGILMLMHHYLDAKFEPEIIERVAQVDHSHYYVMMMRSWFFATALAKQYDAMVLLLETHQLPADVHRMTIQKAVESRRIPAERKQYLKTLRRKNK